MTTMKWLYPRKTTITLNNGNIINNNQMHVLPRIQQISQQTCNKTLQQDFPENATQLERIVMGIWNDKNDRTAFKSQITFELPLTELVCVHPRDKMTMVRLNKDSKHLWLRLSLLTISCNCSICSFDISSCIISKIIFWFS